MIIDLSTLGRAVARLSEAWERHLLDPADDQLRDGLIQRFEFTYELSHKMMRRVLQAGSPDPESVGQADFPNLVRLADEAGLLRSGWPAWKEWRAMRARTSHAYDEAIALEVVAGIPSFLVEARHLLAALEARQG